MISYFGNQGKWMNGWFLNANKFYEEMWILLLAYDDLRPILAMVYIDFEICMLMSLSVLFSLLKMYAFDLVKACLFVFMDFMNEICTCIE